MFGFFPWLYVGFGHTSAVIIHRSWGPLQRSCLTEPASSMVVFQRGKSHFKRGSLSSIDTSQEAGAPLQPAYGTSASCPRLSFKRYRVNSFPVSPFLSIMAESLYTRGLFAKVPNFQGGLPAIGWCVRPWVGGTLSFGVNHARRDFGKHGRRNMGQIVKMWMSNQDGDSGWWCFIISHGFRGGGGTWATPRNPLFQGF